MQPRSLTLAVVLVSSALLAQGAPQPIAPLHQAATTLAVQPTPLLPDHFGEWQASAPEPNSLVPDPAIQKELGVQRTDGKRYTSGGNEAVIQATQMIDSTGAYSAFTLLRTPEMRPCAGGNSLGNDCAVSSGKLLFWSGNTVVSIAPAGSRAVAASAFGGLLGFLPKPLGAKGAQPLLPTREPGNGLQSESVRYAVGPATYTAGGGEIPAGVIDFNKSPEILTAHYAGRGGHGVLTTILYPTPTIAGDRLRALQTAIDSHSLPPAFLAGEPRGVRSGPIVAIASDGFTAKQAEQLAGAVRYEAKVSWNKPEIYIDQMKVPQAASVMVKILFFVGFLTMAALILGIFFGGGRALVRGLRGKPLSSLEDMEIIRLDIPRR